MKEIREITKFYDTHKSSSKHFGLITVISVEGSSYRRVGARMIINDKGEWRGGISGGCLEGDALRRAQRSMHSRKAHIITYDTSGQGDSQVGIGLGCNGIIKVLFNPFNVESENNPIETLRKAIDKRHYQSVITVLESNHSTVCPGNTYYFSQKDADLPQVLTQDLLQTIEHNAAIVLQDKSSTISTIRNAHHTLLLLFEYLPSPIRIVVAGDNYDIYPLLKIAHTIGWDIALLCRPRKLSIDIRKYTDEIYPYEEAHKLPLDYNTAVVLMAHDKNTDFNNLKLFYNKELKYIGILGPRVRAEKMIDKLKIQNGTLQGIHAPVGLDLGAEQPEEIALAICAEILATFRQKDAVPLRFKLGTIHKRN